MKLYYCANLDKVSEKTWEKRYVLIHKLLIKLGVSLVSNIEKKISKGDAEARKSISYNQIEAVIIEGTHIASDTVYIIATALAYKKPVLYLIEKGHSIPEQLLYIRNDKNLGELFFLKFYKSGEKNIQSLLVQFLESLESGHLIKEKFNIKFTLRISARIERYLNWKFSKIKKSKAEYVRDLLLETAKNDKNYKAFLKKQSGA